MMPARSLILFLLAAVPCLGQTGLAAVGTEIRLLLPTHDYVLDGRKAFELLLAEYTRSNPGTTVTVLWRGEEYSSLRELIAMQLAGDLPDIAGIACGEFPALEPLGITVPVPISPRFRPEAVLPEKGAKRAGPHLLPFHRTVPVLIANEESLFRQELLPPGAGDGGSRNAWPKTWNQLTVLASKLASPTVGPPTESSAYGLALPLQGTRGLWIFEALTGLPLWQREPGGLRANRDLAAPIQTLQKLLVTPHVARPDEHLDRAVTDFLERKAPLLVASLDLLPYITRRATFRWTAGPLPRLDSTDRRQLKAELEGGTDLVVTRATPEVRKLLEFLYQPEIAARWGRINGGLPLLSAPPARGSADGAPVLLAQARVSHHRSTDVEIVRARAAWAQALHDLFSRPAHARETDAVFLELDRVLSRK